jgi:hypothetical protein
MSTHFRIGYATTVLLAFATVLFANAAQAMEIRHFDKMAEQDQHNYIVDLVVGAQKVLIDAGKRALADQVDKLFTDIPAGDNAPLGMTEFEINLDRARVADAERFTKDPKAHRLEVEDAMLVTLKKNNACLHWTAAEHGGD